MRWIQGFVALALALIVVGFAFSAGGGGTGIGAAVPGAAGVEVGLRRAADAPRAVPQVITDFRLLRYQPDLSGPAPQACFVFSAALDQGRDYVPFVGVSPERPIALGVKGDTLCVGGISFADQATLTLRAGLPAADGRGLPSDEVAPVEFADRPPYVGFKGTGVILPRLEADGLPVETVNVGSVKVTVRRINDRALVFKRISSGETLAPGEYGWRYGEDDPDDVATPVWSGEMDTAGPPNTPVTTVFPLAEALGRVEPGAYVIELEEVRAVATDESPARSLRWIVFTDLALTSYDGEDGLLVIARSLQTAQPQRGISLTLVARNNEVLATVTTDSDGRARFSRALAAGQGALAPRLIMASAGAGDFSVLDLQRAPVDLSSEGIGGRTVRSGLDAFVYTERGIYRPGETVQAGALVRDAAGRALEREGSLVLYRPNGLEASRLRFDGKANAGAAHHGFELPRTAQRGQWRVAFEADGVGEVGQASFAVEDFVPQRIAVDVLADPAVHLGGVRMVETTARFLYGAPAAGLPVEIEARMQTDPTPFAGFEGFSFGLPAEPFAEEMLDVPSQIADGAGRAVLGVDVGTLGLLTTSPLRIVGVASVIEPGGRAVREGFRFPYRPRPVYLGIKQEPTGRATNAGEASTLSFATVDPTGSGVARELTWRLLAVNYRYDWYREGQEWRWRSTRTVTEAASGRVTTGANGLASVDTRPLEGGAFQLEVSDVAFPDVRAGLEFYAGWGGGVSSDEDAPDRLKVVAATDPVRVGSRTEIEIQAPFEGEADLVVASDRVISVQRVRVRAGGTRVSIPVTAEWGAGAYVMASVYTSRDPVARSRPRRAVGVSYVPVDASGRTFEVTFDTPDVVRPRQQLEVNLRLNGGPTRERAWVTVAAVDEGILRLTKFTTPDAPGWYFGKRALGVEVRDDYGRLLDPNLGAAAEIRSGGDQLGGEGLSVVPSQTVALYTAPVEMRGGRATITLDLPDFNGQLRLMAVAWSATGVGKGEKSLTVRDPVAADLILPRFLAPGDVATATASFDNVEGSAGEYTARASASGSVAIDGDTTRQLRLAARERIDSAFSLRAGGVGVSEVRLSAEGPGQFTVNKPYTIEVRSAFLPARSITRRLVRPGEALTLDASALASYAPGSGEVTVGYSPLPFDMAVLAGQLQNYPYACSEQVASQALPRLLSARLGATIGANDPAETPRTVQASIDTLLNRQDGSGAIGLWRIGDQGATPWLGVYMHDLILRAKAAGYLVPDATRELSLEDLKRIASAPTWGVYGYATSAPWNEAQTQELELTYRRAAAYALYVLAREGAADVSRLRYMHDRELSGLKDALSAAHIGAGLARAGDRSRAVSAFRTAERNLGFKSPVDYHQSALRDLAGATALAAEAGLTDVVERLGRRLGNDVREPEAMTTQEQAFLLMAGDALLPQEGGLSIEAPSGTLTGPAVRVSFTRADLANRVTLTNRSGGPVWQTVMSVGNPVSAPSAAAEGVAVSKAFFATDGRPLNMAEIVQGDRVVVRLTVEQRSRRFKPLIVADLLPAGFEIETLLTPADGADGGAFRWIGNITSPRLSEARDDSYVAAIDLWNNSQTVAYIVRAVTPGEFVLPGTVVEDMYAPDTFARSAAGRVSIAPRG
jgi:uncharacterized protein YfaS (alpha-2-macroglobulin family)